MATTATSATTSSTATIVKTLGSGSGLDTGAIVTALVDAQFAAKNAQLTKQSDKITAQISGVAKLKSGITGFDTALRNLVKGGTLTTQATSSNASVASVTGTAAALSGTLQVNRLASAQAATTNTAIGATEQFAAGSLAITIGGKTTALAVETTDTLTTITAKINAAGLGLKATLVGDGEGLRMTVKGATGAANAFTIGGSDSDPGATTGRSLTELSVGAGATGTTIGTTAEDAELVLDGATFHRATNSVGNLIAGVKLELKGTGSTTLGSAAPSTALGQAVADLVETMNQLHAVIATELDSVTGSLRSDPAATALARALGSLTTVSLATTAAGAPRTLGDIGVRTGRDGTLSIDQARLTKMLVDYPQAVEAMFADGTGATNGGLSAALGAITARTSDLSFGFDAETTRYTATQRTLTDAQAKAADAATAMKDRLTQQFATMDARVAAYKSTGDFLKQQVDAWYKSN